MSLVKARFKTMKGIRPDFNGNLPSRALSQYPETETCQILILEILPFQTVHGMII